MINFVIFDLDGTLNQSGEGIKNSAKYALKKFGIDANDDKTLSKLIGPPLKFGFSEYYGLSDTDSEMAVKYYREYYSQKGIFECVLYSGIEELLSKLKSAGKKLLIATSKPYEYTIKVLENANILHYFDCVEGISFSDEHATKQQLIYNCISKTNAQLDSCVMIGDRKYDIIGAKQNGITSIGVCYGYGSKQELVEHCADYTVDTVEQLENLLFSL